MPIRLAHLNIFTVVAIGALVIWEIAFSHASEVKGLTVVVPPRREECFFERMMTGNRTMVVHYSVVASNGGEYDVNFQVSDFLGRPMITEFRKTISQISLVIKEAGDYQLCFDNTFSHFSTKTVAFEITCDEKTKANWEVYNREELAPEGVYDMAINDIQASLSRVRLYINDVQEYQDAYREVEARDRSLTERNFVFVNLFAATNSVLLLLVGLIQVIFFRSFFEKKNFVDITFDIFDHFSK